jgi:hypothetical protein
MVLRTAQFQIGSEIVSAYIMFNFLVAEEVSGHASLQAQLQLLYIDGCLRQGETNSKTRPD